jgi:hypothetical protein
MICEWWTGKDLEGRGHGVILTYYPGIRLKGLKKQREKSLRVAGLRAVIWTRNLPNTKQEC